MVMVVMMKDEEFVDGRKDEEKAERSPCVRS